MADYKIGERVKKTRGGTGVIRAVFTTMEGDSLRRRERGRAKFCR